MNARLKPWLGYLGIVAAVLAVYSPALHGGFVWDDDGHITRPDLRSLGGLARIWFHPGATQQYYPMLHSAFWAEYHLFGLTPWPYHLVNFLLHALAAILLVRVLRRLQIPGAWLAGFAFAVHPVNVESVAWISEQKNTLSACCYFLAALGYWRWRERPGAGRYLIAFACFLAALLSKSVTATLPAALLLIAWWREPVGWRREISPLLPWFAAALGAGLFTAYVERVYVGAVGASFALSAAQRFLIAGRALAFYAAKLAWPFHLAFIYPRWNVEPRATWQWLFPLVALAVLVGLASRRRSRPALVAALFFAGTLFPALGFIDVYPFVFSFVADHFQYLATAGLLALAGAGATLAIRRWGAPAAAAATLILAGGSALSWRQAHVYADMETLYRATLAENPECWLAHDNLGVVLASGGRLDEAVRHYREAIRLRPDYPEAHNNLGNALSRERRWFEAEREYAEAVRVRPGFAPAEYDWGDALNDQGRPADAVEHYEAALRDRPEYPEAEYKLGNALANTGRIAEGMEHYRRALRLRPAYPEAAANLGFALAMTGHPAEGIPYLEAASRLPPSSAATLAYLGFAYDRAGRVEDAVRAYRSALALEPNNRDVHYQLALALREEGQPAQAAQEMRAAQGR